MALQLVTIPALSDNYTYLLHDPDSGDTAAIDVPDAAPILAKLEKKGWRLTEVWLTHHHADHVQGLQALLDEYPAKVTGAAADAHRLPPLDRQVADGDTFTFGGAEVHVMDVSGHTVGHVAYHVPAASVVFTADSLMALGCGRLFEGTAAQMWQSLSSLAALPPETMVCSGHEYTAANARFALTIEPDNPELISRAQAVDACVAEGRPTVPSLLSDELATNPFLRAARPEVKSAIGMTGAADVDVFAEIRARKDRF